MATPTVSPEVLAKKGGACPMCAQPIVKGEDYIATVDGCNKGWMHGHCAHAFARHREELEELNQELDADGVGEES